MIIFENDDLAIERSGSWHPGFDSAIDLARNSGDVIVGHPVWKKTGTGCDIFGRSSLSIFCVLPDDSVMVMYTFGWRWSESGQRNVLGWWYGDSEWDVVAIQDYGPVLV